MDNELTGKYYFKQSIWGLILMVEYEKVVSDFAGDESPNETRWRKARAKDLIKLPKLK